MHHVDSILSQDRRCGFADIPRLIIDDAGAEERDRAVGLWSRGSGRLLEPCIEAWRLEGQDVPLLMNAQDVMKNGSHRCRSHRPIRECREAGSQPSNHIGVDEQAVTEPRQQPLARARFRTGFPCRHEPWKIDFVRVRWCIGAVIPACFTVKALVDDVGDIVLTQCGDVTVVLVGSVEEGAEGWAEIETAPTPFTDVEDTKGFLLENVRRPIGRGEVKTFQRCNRMLVSEPAHDDSMACPSREG